MANKYSRYQLQDAPSNYVDPKKIEVAELLSERYDKNKQSKDLIDRALSQTELMEGDKIHLERAKGKVKGMLNNHVDKGDWENSSLVVQDAAQFIDTDAGLLAGKKSMANRMVELDYIKKARMEGVELLDFGQDVAKTHTSYVYNEEDGTYRTNVYEAAHEKKLDYASKMTSLLKTIKANGSDGWEGITTAKADGVARMMYGNYMSTAEGRQDMRRLMEIDLPQNLPIEERQRMAQNDIMNRLKGVTRQYVFSKHTTPKGGGGSGSGPVAGVGQSTRISTERDAPKSVSTRSANVLNIMKNTENKDEATIAKELENAEKEQKALEDEAIRKAAGGGEEGEARAKKAYARRDALKASYVDAFGEEDGYKMYLASKSATSYTWEVDNTSAEAFSKSTSIGILAGGAAGTVVPVLGTGIGAIGGGFIGLQNGIRKAVDIEKGTISNVIDWQRSDKLQEDGSWMTGLIVDTEEQQLWEEFMGSEDSDKADFSKLNEILGTNLEGKDAAKVKELLTATLKYQYGEEGEIAGHALDKHVEDNGFIDDAQVYKTNTSKEGVAISRLQNTAIKNLEPENHFIITGGNTQEDWDAWTTKDGKSMWKDAKFFGVSEGDARNNVSPKLKIDINGDTRIVQVKEGSDVADSLMRQMGLHNAVNEESYRRDINNYNATQEKPWSVGQDITARVTANVKNSGGDAKDVVSQIKLVEDSVLREQIIAESSLYLSHFHQDKNGVLSLRSPSGALVHAGVPGEVMTPEAWSLYEVQYSDMINELRIGMRGRDYRDISN